MRPGRSERVAAGGLSLNCVRWGERGDPVLCVHGLTANAHCFQALADELGGERRLLAYDLRGRGESDQPAAGYSVPIHAGDLGALLDALGWVRVALVGHSLGALIGLWFAAHHPGRVSRLVLIDAGAPLAWRGPEAQPAWLAASVDRLGRRFPSFEAYLEPLKRAPHLGPDWNAYLDLYFQHDVRVGADGSVVARCSRRAVLEEGLRLHEADPAAQWPAVRAPTLLLRAGAGLLSASDQLLTEAAAAAIEAGIPNCRRLDFPALNHYTIMFGVDPAVTRAIHDFLSG